MGIEKLIPLAIALAISATASGRLPQIIREIQIAQFRLVKDSRSSKWVPAMLLPTLKKAARKN